MSRRNAAAEAAGAPIFHIVFGDIERVAYNESDARNVAMLLKAADFTIPWWPTVYLIKDGVVSIMEV